MKKNNKFTLRRMIATLGMVLMLSLSLTGMTQPAKALPSVVSAAASIGVSKTSVTFGNYSASTTVTVNDVSTYKATSPYSWIHPTQSGKTVTIRVDAQPYDAVRTGYVVITSGSLERRITVTQYPAMKIYISGDYKNQIVSVTLMGVKNKVDPADARIYVDTYGVLSVKSNNPWISVKLNGGNYFTITAQPNTTLSERRGSVTVSNGFVSRSVTVIQKPLVPESVTSYPYLGPTSFTLNDGLKNAFKNIYQKDKFLWLHLGTKTQKSLLSSLGQKMRDYLGISYSYTITFDYASAEELNQAYSFLVKKGEKVVIDGDLGVTYLKGKNIYVLLVASKLHDKPYEAIDTLFHEYRHAWQYSIQKYGGTMIQYLIQYNNENYKDPEDCADCYRAQFVEKDASSYAAGLFLTLREATK